MKERQTRLPKAGHSLLSPRSPSRAGVPGAHLKRSAARRQRSHSARTVFMKQSTLHQPARQRQMMTREGSWQTPAPGPGPAQRRPPPGARSPPEQRRRPRGPAHPLPAQERPPRPRAPGSAPLRAAPPRGGLRAPRSSPRSGRARAAAPAGRSRRLPERGPHGARHGRGAAAAAAGDAVTNNPARPGRRLRAGRRPQHPGERSPRPAAARRPQRPGRPLRPQRPERPGHRASPDHSSPPAPRPAPAPPWQRRAAQLGPSGTAARAALEPGGGCSEAPWAGGITGEPGTGTALRGRAPWHASNACIRGKEKTHNHHPHPHPPKKTTKESLTKEHSRTYPPPPPKKKTQKGAAYGRQIFDSCSLRWKNSGDWVWTNLESLLKAQAFLLLQEKLSQEPLGLG